MQRANFSFWRLFLSTFQLSAFTFGGGYVIVPLMKERFVRRLGWIDEEEMLDLVSIAQSSPGAMAVNTSILVGYRMAGVPGALVSVCGTALPPLIILSVISLFYVAFRDNRVVRLPSSAMWSSPWEGASCGKSARSTPRSWRRRSARPGSPRSAWSLLSSAAA